MYVRLYLISCEAHFKSLAWFIGGNLTNLKSLRWLVSENMIMQVLNLSKYCILVLPRSAVRLDKLLQLSQVLLFNLLKPLSKKH